MNKKKRVVLLDSHAILHRAYHALPDFISGKGVPTGALYGLATMLLRIADDLEPEYIIATRDLPGATHRHERYEAYKGTRVQADDALIMQLERAPELFAAFGVPVYAAPGFEADDCLGTIVHELSSRSDLEIVIASGDMDTLQLVNEHTRVFTMRKGIHDVVLYDADMVRERYGFGPERITDYKALRGDPSDNIPGVKGIGEKSATEIVQAFGPIESVYETLKHRPEEFAKHGIKPRIAKLLEEQEEQAFFSKSLATIRTDAPINFALPAAPWRINDHLATIDAACVEFDFRSLKDRVRRAARIQDAWNGHDEESESADTEVQPAEEVDPAVLEETSIALWLLHSDITAPSLEDILAAEHTKSFAEARAQIMRDLADTGRLQDVFDTIEKPLIPIVARMHDDGIALDREYLRSLSREYSKELEAIAARIYRAAGREFNLNSPKQLGIVLYDELGIVPVKQKKTATGARTTREEELRKLEEGNPVVTDVLAYREMNKLLGTYIDKMGEMVADDGRLHARFLQAGTTTGRMASESPNLQNIPVKSEYGKRIRGAFVAQEGSTLVAIDYSQIELRIAAGLSGDEKLINIFEEGGDVHASVAAQVFGVAPESVDREMRRQAKVINFGILYGMGVNALRSNLGAGVSREEAARFLENYFATFSGLRAFLDKTVADAKRLGYTETLFGRRRSFAGFKSSLPGVAAQAERMALNAPIQGTQADIIKRAMIDVDRLIEHRRLRGDAKLLLQVHDELVFEVKNEQMDLATELKRTMQEAIPASMLAGVPIVAEVSLGKNWGEMKRI